MPYPEIEFHRYFSSGVLSTEDRKELPGRLDMSTIDQGLASILDDVKHHINAMFSRQAARIQTTRGPVHLHFDYIAAPERPMRHANAIAFGYSGYFFIGLTQDLVQDVFQFCWLLSRSSATADLLHLGLKTAEERDQFLACLFSVQIQFVIDHELGHHFHGHTPIYASNSFFKEFDGVAPVPGLLRLQDQAREVEADGYAVHMMLNGLFADGSGASIIQRLQPTEISSERFLVYFLLLSIGSFLFLRPAAPFDPSRVRGESHPFGLMRMNVVMTDLRGWAEDHKLSLVQQIDQDCFSKVMGTIVAAQPDGESAKAWKLQGEFLTRPDETYRDELYAARAALRAEMQERSWSLDPPSSPDA